MVMITTEPLTVETLPVDYFFNIWKTVKKVAPGVTLVMLRGNISGYLCFEEDAEVVSLSANLPTYRQKVLNHSKMVTYCLIPEASIDAALDTIDEHGFTLADRTPDEGISFMEILPQVQQTSLF